MGPALTSESNAANICVLLCLKQGAADEITRCEWRTEVRSGGHGVKQGIIGGRRGETENERG